jgi:protein-tyrosine-phosphatase
MPARRARILFVCFANSCRSQMAEAFARAYGKDVVSACSAGLQPAARVSRATRKVMMEKQIDLLGQAPKRLSELNLDQFDLIVNLSDHPLPRTGTPMLNLPLPDPVGKDDVAHRGTRDHIEWVVMNLISNFRKAIQAGGTA